MSESVEAVVIGAGAVGLAIARALARAGLETLILEAGPGIGAESSSRNSEVIHAGIYYPTGSLKARLCVAGRQQLYAYCAVHGVEHKRIGKLIVAADDSQIPALKSLQAKATENGVMDLAWIDRRSLQTLEPSVSGVAALHSPSTGIIDSHGLMLSYLGEAESAGAALALRSPVEGGRVTENGFTLKIASGQALSLDCRYLVNAAGLGAPAVARGLRGFDPALVGALHLAKGNYFVLARPSPFTRLIYPMPEPGGLGVHLTLDLAGRARFGPDVEWVESIDYRVDPSRAGAFYRAIRRYWPALPDDALEPGYCGIRPKLSGPGAPADDFMVQGPGVHGIPGLINLFGIESPGLTASLALADLVLAELGLCS
jgi:L-2-hydroxyglutarate oxidase LhgO